MVEFIVVLRLFIMNNYKSNNTDQHNLLSQNLSISEIQQKQNVFGPIRKALVNNEARLVFFLSILACFLLVAYFFYAFYIPQTPGRMTRPSAALIKELPLWSFVASLPFPMLQSKQFVAVFLIVITVAAFTVYGLAVYLSWNRRTRFSSIAVVVITSALFFLIAALSLPNLNTDIYNYITRARVAAVHNSNPHYVPASKFPDDPLYPYASPRISWIVGDKLAMWTIISIPLAKLAGDNAVTNLLVFRFAFFLFNVANVFLVAMILRKLSPSHLLAGLIFYSWNPIIVILGQSKTDTVMVFFILLAIMLLITERKHLAVVSMGLSVLIKLITLPLVAVYWLRELRLKRWRDLIVMTLLLALTVIIAYTPFWEDSSLIQSHMGVALGESGAAVRSIPKSLLITVFMLLTFWVGFTQNGDNRKLIRGWALIMLVFALGIARFTNSWYLITLIAIVSLCADWSILLVAIVITFSAFLFNMWYSTSSSVFPLPNLFPYSRYLVFLAPVSIAGLCIIAIGLWHRLRKREQVS